MSSVGVLEDVRSYRGKYEWHPVYDALFEHMDQSYKHNLTDMLLLLHRQFDQKKQGQPP